MTTFDTEAAFIADVLAEVARARGLFPGNSHRIAALVEELGEACQALLDFDQGMATPEDVLNELTQCAAMVVRLAMEGDASLSWRIEMVGGDDD